MFGIFKHESRYFTGSWEHFWAWQEPFVHMPNLMFGNLHTISGRKWRQTNKKCSGTISHHLWTSGEYRKCACGFNKMNFCLNWPNTEPCLSCHFGKSIQSMSTMWMLRRIQVQTNMESSFSLLFLPQGLMDEQTHLQLFLSKNLSCGSQFLVREAGKEDKPDSPSHTLLT